MKHLVAVVVLATFLAPDGAQAQARKPASAKATPVAARTGAAGDLESPSSQLRGLIERYVSDRGSLTRYTQGAFGAGPGRGTAAPAGGDAALIGFSPDRAARYERFYKEWLALLEGVEFESLAQDARIEHILFRSHLQHEMRKLAFDRKAAEEVQPLAAFAGRILSLEEARRRMEPVDAYKVAAELNALNREIQESRKKLEAGRPNRPAPATGAAAAESLPAAPAKEAAAAPQIKRTVANRAAATVNQLRGILARWYGFYNGYDPLFTWWAEQPYKTLDKTLQDYATYLRETLAGARDRNTIIGDPIGREALLQELSHEMIPYTPEELIELANREFAWCEAEMKKASREMGFGDDWKKALEHVKTLHVPPGKQPELIRTLAIEAIDFVKQHDLVTVPELAAETWRMEMMTPERQLVSPFFLGGEVIQVSYPTNTMTHEQKMMSMRGNNPHFSRATVHHELIPGHHLQGFMGQRYRPYRATFGTPFYGEGWSLYWEMLLWDMGFAKTPEDRAGFLFWRMHRCARIIFSLSFHLEKMTAQEAVDFLVDKVGHERDNAEAEVRRSVEPFGYGPLYQAAYLLGGLQIRALHKQLVGGKVMTNRQFHDAVLKENRIPIEMVRAALTNQKLAREFEPSWRFYDDLK